MFLREKIKIFDLSLKTKSSKIVTIIKSLHIIHKTLERSDNQNFVLQKFPALYGSVTCQSSIIQ